VHDWGVEEQDLLAVHGPYLWIKTEREILLTDQTFTWRRRKTIGGPRDEEKNKKGGGGKKYAASNLSDLEMEGSWKFKSY